MPSYKSFSILLFAAILSLGRIVGGQSMVSPYPSRSNHEAFWIGDRILFYGGAQWYAPPSGPGCNGQILEYGETFKLPNEWRLMSAQPFSLLDDETARYAIWTGRKLIVWGREFYGSWHGGVYDPTSDTWNLISSTNGPEVSWGASVVWTGKEMVIWGGRVPATPNTNRAAAYTNRGAAYNPSTNKWRPVPASKKVAPRADQKAVWTGKEMIIIGGENASTYTLPTARYVPGTNTWSLLPTPPSVFNFHGKAVWTGSKILYFGEDEHGHQRGILEFDPVTNAWSYLNSDPLWSQLEPRYSVWTGSEVVIWGGKDFVKGSTFFRNYGLRFNPVTNLIAKVSPPPFPIGKISHSVTWTGNEIIVWGGLAQGFDVDTPCVPAIQGAAYNPITKKWRKIQ